MRVLLASIVAVLAAGCQEYGVQGKVDPETPTTPTPTTPEPPPPPPPAVPDIEVSPVTVDFGAWPPTCTSDRREVVVSNVGEADLTVSAIDLDNADAVFRILATPTPLAPGESLTFELDFTPIGFETYDASSVHVASDDPDEPVVDVALVGEGSEEGSYTDLFQQADPEMLDILWVIDNSGSMAGEVDNLADTFDVFISGFVALGLDFQLGVVTTDMADPLQSGRLQGSPAIITSASADPAGDFANNVDLGSAGSGDEKGLDAAYAALTSPLIDNENLGLVRAGSNLSVIVVTDEDDSSAIAPVDFANWLEAYQGDAALASFSAVAGPTSGLLPCFALFSGVVAEPAPTYWSAVSRTGGVQLSICDMDMTDILTQLAMVSSGLVNTFPLTLVPTSAADIVVTVDGVVVPHDAVNGADYDAVANAVILNGTSMPLPGQSIEITYPTGSECPL